MAPPPSSRRELPSTQGSNRVTASVRRFPSAWELEADGSRPRKKARKSHDGQALTGLPTSGKTAAPSQTPVEVDDGTENHDNDVVGTQSTQGVQGIQGMQGMQGTQEGLSALQRLRAFQASQGLAALRDI
jgi:hypothetical protein